MLLPSNFPTQTFDIDISRTDVLTIAISLTGLTHFFKVECNEEITDQFLIIFLINTISADFFHSKSVTNALKILQSLCVQQMSTTDI